MKALRNIWYVIGYSSEVNDEDFLHRTVIEDPILVYRKKDGTLAALWDICPHRFVPLHMGRRIDDTIECGYHGLRFDCTGACVHNPIAGAPIPKRAKVKSYPVVERDTLIWVWLGEPEKADEALIPNFDFLANPQRANVAGYTIFNADYQLAVDNLSDLTHVQFLHADQQAVEAFPRLKMDVRQEGNSVYTTLLFPNGRPPKFLERKTGGINEPIDLAIETRWDAPSCIKLTSRGYTVGEDRRQLFEGISAHILTAETSRTTHYFHINTRDYEIHNKEVDQIVRDWQRKGFYEEDKVMIEAQQHCIRDEDIMTLGPVLLPTDAGAVRVRRVLASMMQSEGLPTAPAERHE